MVQAFRTQTWRTSVNPIRLSFYSEGKLYIQRRTLLLRKMKQKGRWEWDERGGCFLPARPYQQGNLGEDRKGGKESTSPIWVESIQAEAGTRAWLVKAKPGEWRAHRDSSEMRYGRKQECGQIARGLEGQSGTVHTNVPTGQDATEEFQTAADLT